MAALDLENIFANAIALLRRPLLAALRCSRWRSSIALETGAQHPNGSG
jgi:hypothetical protein